MLKIYSMNGQRFQKIILAFMFVFLTIALIVTWNSPATGYESSIYQSTPIFFWVALISSIIVGISIVIFHASNSNFNSCNLWKYGFLLIILIFTISLGLFIIRGYYLWCIWGDPASHIGFIKQILVDGHTMNTIFYPITHIFLSEISIITTLNPFFLSKTIPLLFGLLSILFLFILVRSLSTNLIEPVIAGIIGCSFVFGWYLNLTPNGLANLFFPLALFLMFKYLHGNTISWGIPLFIIILLYPIFHPVPAIFLGLAFLTVWIPFKLSNFQSQTQTNLHYFNFKLALPGMVLLLWFIFWISMFSVWGLTISDIYNIVINEKTGSTQLSSLTDQISNAHSYGYNVLEYFIKQYGNITILFILSIISFFILRKLIINDQKRIPMLSLFGPFGASCIIILALFISSLSLSPSRFFVYVSIFGTIFSAFILTFLIFTNLKSRRISNLISIGTIVLLVGIFACGLFNLYPSPYNVGMNSQTTHYEVSGMEHFLNYHDISTPVSGFTESPGRFVVVILTPMDLSKQQVPYYFTGDAKTPWHFGYDKFSSIALSYRKETDLILTQRDKKYYIDIFPDMAKKRFAREDFNRLDTDNGAGRIYSNGEFDYYRISQY